MQILLDESEVERGVQSFMQYLKKECRPVPARLRWRGAAQEEEVFWNEPFHFWFAHKRTANRHWFQAGLHDPVACGQGVLQPVCEMSFPLCGFDRRNNCFFLRFGKDVLIAHSGAPGKGEAGLLKHLELHDYDLATHAMSAPDGQPLEAVIVSGVSSPSLAFDFARFVSAVNDWRQWEALGLNSGAQPRIQFGIGHSVADRACADAPAGSPRLHALVVDGVRDQLVNFTEARKLRCRAGSTPSDDIVLVTPDNAVLAALQVKTSLAPGNLYAGVGQLLLSRSTLRAAKFLVVPGTLGPYFTQTLFRHDIHVATYKLTQDMSVVFDAQAVFDAALSLG